MPDTLPFLSDKNPTFSHKSVPISSSFSQTLSLPDSFAGLRKHFRSRVAQPISLTWGSQSGQSFFVKASSKLPLVGNPASDCEAEDLKHHDLLPLSRPRNTHFPIISSKTITPLPPKPPQTTELASTVSPSPLPSQRPNKHPRSDFQEKVLYLDSIGLDFLSLINRHPPIVNTSLSDLKSTVEFLTSMGFTALELHRMLLMCPQILTAQPSAILPVFTFLLREVHVNGSDLKRVINRRPRLLACSVESRLRPTLYFLQSIGISEVCKHTSLLSCSVEQKFIPRIEYFQKIGFSHRETLSMFRRFPQLFNYSIKDNYEPKLNYFVVEMGRDLKELKEFPQYFSFCLANRIKPRHQCCVEKGVCFPLPLLLKTSEVQFRNRLEVCCNSTMPLRNSPLWCTNCSIDY